MGLGMRYGAGYLEKNQILPFGKWTLPIMTHSASFGALHGMGEVERQIGLRPREGSWASRLLLDGAFYLQATAAHPVGETLMGEKFTGEIQGLERFNNFASKLKPITLLMKEKAQRISRAGPQDPSTLWVRLEPEVADDGRIVHDEEFYPLTPEKKDWWIGRHSRLSLNYLDVPFPHDAREVSRQHAHIKLDEQGNYVFYPTYQEPESFGYRSNSIIREGYFPLTKPEFIAKGTKLLLDSKTIVDFNPDGSADLSVFNRNLQPFHAEISVHPDGRYVISPTVTLTGRPGESRIGIGYGNWEPIVNPVILQKGTKLMIGESRILQFGVPTPPPEKMSGIPIHPPPRPGSLGPLLPVNDQSPPRGPNAALDNTMVDPAARSGEIDRPDPTHPDHNNPTLLPPPMSPDPSDPTQPTLLMPGEMVLATGENQAHEPRRASHYLRLSNFGDVAAFTDAGLSKHQLEEPDKFPYPVNEDAYGIGFDMHGQPVFVVKDGMGKFGHGADASARGVETVLKTVAAGDFTLGEALKAHEAIRRITPIDVLCGNNKTRGAGPVTPEP
jgi:hypothetical protein